MGMEKHYKSLLFLLIPVILVLLFTVVVQGSVLKNQEVYTQWLLSFGPWFLVVYIIVQIIAIIIAPLGGFFIQVGLFAILPPVQALLLIYVVTTPGFFINFYLAKRYGRPIVIRLIGKSAMEKVDLYSKDAGPVTLILLKIFQAGIFDYASYAAGLTKIKPSVFFLINIFGGLPGILVSYLILTKFTNFTVSIMVLLFTGYFMFGLSLLVMHLKRKKEEEIKNIATNQENQITNEESKTV